MTALRAPLQHGATSATLSVLIVGAGAVGQVLGRHLARGGASVTFLVREKYAEETRRGFTMRPLNGGGRASRHFDSFEVVTAVEEGARYDQVHLAIPSPIARGWLEPLARATPGATIVSYQPALDDRATILDAGVTEDRLVAALVGFIAYAAPLEGEEPRLLPGGDGACGPRRRFRLAEVGDVDRAAFHATRFKAWQDLQHRSPASGARLFGIRHPPTEPCHDPVK